MKRRTNIAGIELENAALLAPMEDVSDIPFRRICRRMGADIVYTEFVNAEGLIRESWKAWRKLELADDERPAGIQIYGASTDAMVRAAKIAAERGPDIIDINAGCWVPKVAQHGAGAGLLRDLGAMTEVASRVASAVDVPVTLKTRLGWDESSICILDVAERLEDCGIRALTIHCRVRTQGHSGQADWSWLPRIKEVTSLPVILNGDVVCGESAERAFETGCDGVMIARGAIGNPWVFREVKHRLRTGESLPPPTVSERVAMVREHLESTAELRDERSALVDIRRHLGLYLRGLVLGKVLRGELAHAKSLEAMTGVLERVRELNEGETERQSA
ncbi:MAG: tRNA dihydrouridine synthase DusB [Planctomycetota bacterium]